MPCHFFAISRVVAQPEKAGFGGVAAGAEEGGASLGKTILTLENSVLTLEKTLSTFVFPVSTFVKRRAEGHKKTPAGP